MVQKMQLLRWYAAAHDAGMRNPEALMKMIDLLLNWLRRGRDRELLCVMTERELCDLGIGRGEIPFLLRGTAGLSRGAAAQPSTSGR